MLGRFKSRGLLASLAGIWLALPAAADHTFLSLPIECEIGLDCYIQNYVDTDPSEGTQDYTCGSLSYDTHRGTDIRIRGVKEMQKGVTIVAAAAGVVTGVRDGMKDISIRKIKDPDQIRQIKTKSALGNAVVIRHDHGLVAYYGHLREGSVVVQKGQRVTRGEPLGFVGLSGDTKFPHVHFEVRRKGKVVDPFTGLDAPADCHTKSGTPLWHPDTFAKAKYVSTGLHAAGFSTVKPDMEGIDAGRYDESSLDQDSPALLFWAMVYGPRAGDKEFIKLIGPDSEVLAQHDNIVSKNQAQKFMYIGKLRRDAWHTGTYMGVYALRRGPAGSEETVVEVERAVQIR